MPIQLVYYILLALLCGRIAQAADPVAKITPFGEFGGRLDWSGANGKIAVDKIGPNGFFDVYTVSPDGSDAKCITCGKPVAPAKHKGNPAWHPSGKYIVFQAENDFQGFPQRLWDYLANPGAGVNNDLWLTDAAGSRFWRLTKVPYRLGGVLHPHFSHRGDKLLWSERFGKGGRYGEWAIKLADFSIQNGEPRLSNIQTLRPGRRPEFYETHGFTPDDSTLIFSANSEPGQDALAIDIYTYNLRTNELKNLTQSMDDGTSTPISHRAGRKSFGCAAKATRCPRSPAAYTPITG